jgi:hypothetical protein
LELKGSTVEAVPLSGFMPKQFTATLVVLFVAELLTPDSVGLFKTYSLFVAAETIAHAGIAHLAPAIFALLT